MFAPGSRYERVPDAIHVDRGGRARPYKLLHTFPPGGPTLRTIEVADGDRLDLVAFRFYGDPEQFWRICDGNLALWPGDLEVAGTRVRIQLAAV
jgi:hypothetical protein